jgi:hypothetical protein
MRKKHVLDQKPLSLDKSTIREITSDQMHLIAGGRTPTTGRTCTCS